MLDQAALPWFAELNGSLNDTLDDAAFTARLRASVAQLRKLAGEILERARLAHPGLEGGALQALLETAMPAVPAGAVDPAIEAARVPMLFEVA
jgi:hypothetical protein